MRAACLTAALALLTLGGIVRAEAPPDPLRLVPRHTDLVLRVDSPRKLVETVLANKPLHELMQFTAVREFLASTNVRRLEKILAYYEKDLGAAWPDLLDRLAGGGIVLAATFERGGNAPVLFVVQSKDEDLLKRTIPLVLNVIEQEQARLGSKDKLAVETYRGLEVTHIGKDFHVARAGSALLVSDKAAGVHAALDLYINGSQESLTATVGPADARKLLPPHPLWSVWVNLVPAQQSPEGQQLFNRPRSDPMQTVIFGGLLDVVGQSPFVAAGVYYEPDGTFRASVRLPRGRDATPDGQGVHLATADQPGCLPPLETKNVLFSTSFYLDQAKFWTERDKLLTEGARKQLDQAEKAVGNLLAGRKLSDLLTQSGPYHRFVAAAQEKSGYAKHPTQTVPAFAYAVNMRDPEFGRALGAILRATALLTGAQYRLKMVEEEINGVKLVGYRFPEDASVPGDPQYARFNYSPCFATVGDQFFAASTLEFGRELVGVLKRPTAVQPPASTTVDVSRAYAVGGAALLKLVEDQLVVQAAMDRSLRRAAVRPEIQALIGWVERLGRLDFQSDYLPHEFRLEIQWKQGK